MSRRVVRRCFINSVSGDFPGGPVVKTELPWQGAQVLSLVMELRFQQPNN